MGADMLEGARHALLPVRPRPVSGESTGGYLMRVAGANGFASVARLRSTLKSSSTEPLAELFERLQLSAEEWAGLYGPVPRSWSTSPPLEGLPATDFNFSCRRWCPTCLGDSCAHEGRWGLKLACVCVRHAVWLRESCPRCGQLQRWSVTYLDRCECGARLAEVAVEPASAAMAAITARLFGRPLASSAVGLDQLVRLRPCELSRLIRYLGQFGVGSQPAKPGKISDLHRLAVAKRLVEGALDLMLEWPKRLDGLLMATHRSGGDTPSVKRTFSALYRVLYQELQGPAYQFLRDAFEDYLHRNWWGIVCKRNRLFLSGTVQGHPRLTMRRAAEVADLAPAVLQQVAQQSLFGESVTLPSGRRFSTLHVDEVAHIASAARGAQSMAQLARTLELPASRTRELVAAGVIAPLIARSGDSRPAAWLFAHSEIDRFMIEPAEVSDREAVSLRHVLRYGQLRTGDAAEIVRAVLEQRLTTWGRSSEAVPIGRALLDREVLRHWLIRRRSQGSDMSIDQASRVLGIKQQTAYDLVRRGMLRSVRSDRECRRISTADLEGFRVRYVSLVDLANAEKCAPRALLPRINARPVCGPSVDGARQYFFRRSDLDRFPREGARVDAIGSVSVGDRQSINRSF